MARTVEIDEDIFIELLWDRVNEFKYAQAFDEEFWTEAFERLSDMGWFKPNYNNPSYIVDNISINGSIFHKDDCRDNFDDIDEKYDGDVDAWIEDNGYEVVGDYVVLNWGL